MQPKMFAFRMTFSTGTEILVFVLFFWGGGSLKVLVGVQMDLRKVVSVINWGVGYFPKRGKL